LVTRLSSDLNFMLWTLFILPGQGWHRSFPFEQPALRRSGLLWPLCALGREWRHALLLGPGLLSWWQLSRICDTAGNGCLADRADENGWRLAGCPQRRRSGRDGGHGRRLASAWLWSLDGLNAWTLIFVGWRFWWLDWVQDSICYGENFDHSLDNK